MRIEPSEKLERRIQAYAAANGCDLDQACLRLISLGLAVYRSEQTSAKIPAELKGLIVSDYHTVSGWARFKGTRMPLQVLVDNLLAGMTPAEFIEDYGSLTLEDIARVQQWLGTLPPWNGKSRESMPDAYRFMVQDDSP
jgi:uncharacterized protein (DUF433 family)